MTTLIKTEPNNIEQLKKSYQADQQLKYIHLEAEIDLLRQKIQLNKIKPNINN